jgi:hypothetical protein
MDAHSHESVVAFSRTGQAKICQIACNEQEAWLESVDCDPCCLALLCAKLKIMRTTRANTHHLIRRDHFKADAHSSQHNLGGSDFEAMVRYSFQLARPVLFNDIPAIRCVLAGRSVVHDSTHHEIEALLMSAHLRKHASGEIQDLKLALTCISRHIARQL